MTDTMFAANTQRGKQDTGRQHDPVIALEGGGIDTAR
ncbi:Uncharacterised protein [Serratia fonticola]|uniref:Uncharacterized protein n=1 Tax=Serratia fonticola TaxID=47917 RepID=A0A4U9W916_SERFO|nr:Uncharacterised protein [Serratia fonticola]